jgi:rhodanese-related sulfurtransferase
MSRLSQEGTDALSETAQSQDATLFVMCHHGTRSMQVTAWLDQQGWKNATNVRGGIDAYAREVDPSVGLY